MECARQDIVSQALGTSERAVVEVTVEDLVREHARFVYRVAYSVLRNHHDAEDAAQETFVRVLRHTAELTTVQDHRLWLARIAWRIAVDRSRKKREQSLEEIAAAGAQFAWPQSGAEQALIGEQQVALLERLMATLPRDLRETLALATVQEMSTAAIAQVMGIPEGTVRQRLFRARQILREKVAVLMEG